MAHKKKAAPEALPMVLLTREEAADRLHVSVRTIDRLIVQGDLPAWKFGARHVRIDEADLTGLLSRKDSGERR